MKHVAKGFPQWIEDHVELYLSDPEKAHYWNASLGGGQGKLPTLLLTTRGRKSGQTKHSPLIYKQVGNDYVVIASKGGAPAHPFWFLNLEATPEAEIRVGVAQHKVRARIAEGDERARLWSAMVAIYAPYEDYEARAGERHIPVVVLEVV